MYEVVDIKNVKDPKELESRLYAHMNKQHEFVAANQYDAGSCGTTSGTNIALSTSYWASRETGIPQQPHFTYRSIQQPKQRSISSDVVDDGDTQYGKQIKCSGNSKTCDKLDKRLSLDSNRTNNMPTSDRLPNKFRKSDPAKSHQDISAIHASASIGQILDLKGKINPCVNNSNNKESLISNENPKQHGPDFQHQQQLENPNRVENNKQKLRKVSTKATKQTSSDVIDLISSDESDCSDVVVITAPSSSSFIVDDSDDDVDEVSVIAESIIVKEEEIVHIQLPSFLSFIKPQYQPSQPDCAEKRLDNISRCTSPCSIQFSVVDRSRQRKSASDMSDDDDILLLTSDTEAPQSVEHDHVNQSTIDNNANANDSSEFATTKTSSASCNADYGVEQTHFRPLDVFEIESDITDVFYSKETPKTTVIRKIDISSDELEDTTVVNVRTKRLRKRRASTSNKGSDVQPTSDEDECYNSGTERTGIPFISRGPAVERKIRKQSSSPSTCSIASAIGKSTSNMSAGDFIAKQNNLLQGHDGENEAEDSDDWDNAPSAREIAEEILGENTSTVPKDISNRPNEVLSSIDIIDESDEGVLDKQGELEITECDDLHCNDKQKAIVYKSVPNEDTSQINEQHFILSDVWQTNEPILIS